MIELFRNFRLDVQQEDRITVWIDVANRSVNVFREEIFEELLHLLNLIQSNYLRDVSTDAPGLSVWRPIVFRSSKPKGFVVGADLRRILSLGTNAQIQEFMKIGQDALNVLEHFPGMTIALISGACLGGGLEFALACRYRFAVDAPETQLGMPEAKLGLMPGWGGTQRVPEKLGVENGLSMLLSGQSVDAKQANALGLVDCVLDSEDRETELTEALRCIPLRCIPKAFDQRNRDDLASQWNPWDRSKRSAFTPAQRAIYTAVEMGVNRNRERGFQAEREQFFDLLNTPEVRSSLKRFA